MLFNSFEFIFAFLPIALIGFFALARRLGPGAAAGWLALVSVGFYGWWNPRFVGLLLASILFNFWAGKAIAAALARTESGAAERTASALVQALPSPQAKALLVAAVAANLALLALFKYADFFIGIGGALAGASWPALGWVLPLGISFFTFTQIAFLVDVYRGEVRDASLVHYLLFVTWFPHLIAGPVIHHAQVMPQFAAARTYRPAPRLIAAGLTVFSLGLAKKVLLADSFGEYAAPVFGAADAGQALSALAAWAGMLAYTLQLYFDFSGYSDMACGLSLMFGIRLPINFNSPYQAWNLIEFWRRWHITLSQFLRDYLYVPLGGNRRGRLRRYANLLATMLLGGLWHGASWNFVLWGAIHGVLLAANHGWHSLRGALGMPVRPVPSRGGRVIGITLTFLAVVVAWVPFRCADLPATGRLLGAAFDPTGWPTLRVSLESISPWASWPNPGFERWLTGLPPTLATIQAGAGWPLLALGLAIVMLAPNVGQLAGVASVAAEPSAASQAASPRIRWRPSAAWATVAGLLLGLSLLNLSRVSPFLYFQF